MALTPTMMEKILLSFVGAVVSVANTTVSFRY